VGLAFTGDGAITAGGFPDGAIERFDAQSPKVRSGRR
jgi:hypothetical protein